MNRLISDLSEEEKPREKALAKGIRSLSNAELLAVIFGGGLPGMSVIDMSRDILAMVDNKLAPLAGMSIPAMVKTFHGVGIAKAVALSAAFELGLRCRDENADRKQISVRSSDDAFRFIRHRFEHLDHEQFWIIILNRANRIVTDICISSGGTAMTVVDVKIILREAIDRMASAIILAHNHPSGNLAPSPQDDTLTSKITQAAALLDIRVLDHLIITDSGFYSYSDQGRMKI
ncbi:MAG: DNA repair protein RadC [Paramuribaculum sp.]|nr:DNA repair protein RadC [Paramuribaculum sp.]